MIILNLYNIIPYFIIVISANYIHSLSDKEIINYRDEVKSMFQHAYDGYIQNAYPYDELRPLTCDGHDTWGSYSLTLIDALDTLAVMGNKTEFQRVAKLVSKTSQFDIDINVSVFETNIRILGGLLSAHLMSKRMGFDDGGKWPCDGPLLRLAQDVANRIIPAFDTPTGMPYGTVNLRHGVPPGETAVTCVAGIGTYVIEFGTLSKLTNNPIYEEVAVRAMLSLWQHKSSINLLGNHIDVITGRWTAQDSGIGAGVDSYFEYLVKGSLLLRRPELMAIFHEARAAIEKHLRHEDWYLWGTMNKGHITMAVFQSLEAFWPGTLTMIGDLNSAQRTIFNYHQVWKQFGFTPESYNIAQGETSTNREGYPLRPELAESLVYLYQATGDHTFLDMGADIVTSIMHSSKTSCGFATIKNVNDHSLENRMESFFLAETTKYLYLLFDHDHWLHNKGSHGTYHEVGNRSCILDAGGYIYNSEAHPMDPGALACCSGPSKHEIFFDDQELIDFVLDPSKPLEKFKKEEFINYNTIKEEFTEKEHEGETSEDGSKEDSMIELELKQDDVKLSENVLKIESDRPKMLPEEVFHSSNIDTETDSKDKQDNEEIDEKDNSNIGVKHLTKRLSKINKQIELDRQATEDSLTEMENSGVTPSVSSSKYSLDMAKMAENRLSIMKDSLITKPRRNKTFSWTALNDRLKIDLSAYSNFTRSVSHSILSCPHPAFVSFLNHKGIIFS